MADPITHFEGGVKEQREKLNSMVDSINDHETRIKAIEGVVGKMGGPALTPFIGTLNGGLAQWIIPAYYDGVP